MRFKLLEPEDFAHAALDLAEASHFAAEVQGIEKWFHPAGRTREIPFVEGDPPPGLGCVLDPVARETVKRFVDKATRRGSWRPRSRRRERLWHWYVYTDDRVLVAAFDWPSHNVLLDPALRGWAEGLQREGVLGPELPARPIEQAHPADFGKR